MTDIQLQATWEEILKNLENSLSTRVCNNWLKPLKPIKLTTEMLELGAPNVFTKNWVEKYYLPFLTDSCYEITKAHLEDNSFLDKKRHLLNLFLISLISTGYD